MNKPMMRDSYASQEQGGLYPEPISELDAWALKLNKKGNMDPTNKEHASEIQRMALAAAQGQLSEKAVMNIANLNPKAAPVLLDAFGQYKAASGKQKDVQGIVGQYINEGSPATTENVGPPTQEGQYGLREIPAVPAKSDYAGLVNKLAQNPAYIPLAEQYKKLGGIDNKEESLFSKINPKDYTNESITKFEQSKRFSDLVPTKDTDPSKLAEHSKGLRTEFNTLAKNFIDVRDSYARIQESISDPSPAGDMATIFGFMRMLDPTSTVREGEYATAEKARGVPDTVRNLYNKVLEGYRLTPEQRKDFSGRAGKLYDRQEHSHKQLESQYTGLARRLGIPADTVVSDFKMNKDKRNPIAPASPTGNKKLRYNVNTGTFE